jgi:hypothetical protein
MSSLLNSKLPYYSGEATAPNETTDAIFIPYTVWIKVVPKFGQGARLTYVRSLEKMAWAVENALTTAAPTPFNIATPVASTFQFGDNYARLTIIGFDPQKQITSTWKNNGPTTPVLPIHSGTYPTEKTAPYPTSAGGSLSYGQDTTVQVDAAVKALRNALFAAVNPVLSSMSVGFIKDNINAIEYNGVKYGVKKQGGRSFPL